MHADVPASYGMRGELNFRIEIFVNIRGGQKVEIEKLLAELALLTARLVVNISIRKFDFSRLPYVHFCV
jgi:hypothetical protein